jgi:hypothetical protein
MSVLSCRAAGVPCSYRSENKEIFGKLEGVRYSEGGEEELMHSVSRLRSVAPSLLLLLLLLATGVSATATPLLLLLPLHISLYTLACARDVHVSVRYTSDVSCMHVCMTLN